MCSSIASNEPLDGPINNSFNHARCKNDLVANKRRVGGASEYTS
jgi:hypothetical protein